MVFVFIVLEVSFWLLSCVYGCVVFSWLLSLAFLAVHSGAAGLHFPRSPFHCTAQIACGKPTAANIHFRTETERNARTQNATTRVRYNHVGNERPPTNNKTCPASHRVLLLSATLQHALNAVLQRLFLSGAAFHSLRTSSAHGCAGPNRRPANAGTGDGRG